MRVNEDKRCHVEGAGDRAPLGGEREEVRGERKEVGGNEVGGGDWGKAALAGKRAWVGTLSTRKSGGHADHEAEWGLAKEPPEPRHTSSSKFSSSVAPSLIHSTLCPPIPRHSTGAPPANPVTQRSAPNDTAPFYPAPSNPSNPVTSPIPPHVP